MEQRNFILILTLCFAVMTTRAQSEKAVNIFLICIDALQPVLASFEMEYIHSPNIDKLAPQGLPFLNHLINSPRCGPYNCILFVGKYGLADNRPLFQNDENIKNNPNSVHPKMPECLNNMDIGPFLSV